MKMRHHTTTSIEPGPQTKPCAKPRGRFKLRRSVRRRSGILCATLVAGVCLAHHNETFLEWLPGYGTEAVADPKPIDPETLIRKAEVAARMGSHSEEARLWELLCTQHPDHDRVEDAQTSLVRAHLAANEVQEAHHATRRFLARDPKNKALPEVLLEMASALYETNQFRPASETYTQLIALVTRGQELVIEEAGIRSIPRAPKSWRAWKALKREKQNQRDLERVARFNQALCLEQDGEAEVALRSYERFLSRFPMDERGPEAHFRMAVIHTQSRDHEKAIRHFETACRSERAPNAIRNESIYRAGRLYESLRRFDKAEDIYRLAIEAKPATDEFRLASLGELSRLIEEDEPIRVLELYREIADHSTAPTWQAIAFERLTTLQRELAMASAGP